MHRGCPRHMCARRGCPRCPAYTSRVPEASAYMSRARCPACTSRVPEASVCASRVPEASCVHVEGPEAYVHVEGAQASCVDASRVPEGVYDRGRGHPTYASRVSRGSAYTSWVPEAYACMVERARRPACTSRVPEVCVCMSRARHPAYASRVPTSGMCVHFWVSLSWSGLWRGGDLAVASMQKAWHLCEAKNETAEI